MPPFTVVLYPCASLPTDTHSPPLGRRNAHDVHAGDSDLGMGPSGSGDFALRSLCAQHPVPGQPGAPDPRRKPEPATGAGAVPAVK